LGHLGHKPEREQAVNFDFLQFGLSCLVTALFVAGTWLLIRAMGDTKSGSSVPAAFQAVLGLGLKFPAVMYVLKMAKCEVPAEKNGAIVGVVLVYFVSVVGAAIVGARQNRKDQ
jgi:hypothetical protein